MGVHSLAKFSNWVLKAFGFAMLTVLAFAESALGIPITFDPQNYQYRYDILGQASNLNGLQIVDLNPGNYTLRVGDSSNIGITVDASGNVTTTNPSALQTGAQSVTFNNVAITIDPGDFELNNSERWGVRGIKVYVSGASSLGPQSITLVPKVTYFTQLGVLRGFPFDIDGVGNISVPNGVSAIGGFQSLTFNTQLVTVDPGDYALNTNSAFAVRFIHKFAPAPTGGAQSVYLVPETINPYRLVLGPITGVTGFDFQVDGSGIASAVNGVSATSGPSLLSINAIPIQVDQLDYALNSIAAFSVRFIHTFQSATAGPQTVYLAPGVSNYDFVAGVLTGSETFDIAVDTNGNVSAVNGVSASGGPGFLNLNTVDITVDPDGYTGNWSVRFIHSTSGIDVVRLIPGVNSYLLAPFPQTFQNFNVLTDGSPIPATIPFTVNTDQFDFLLTAGTSPPVADAGDDQTADEGDMVVLDGAASFDPQNDPLSFLWTQTAGPNVTLQGATTSTASFVAPYIGANSVATFELVVSDGTGDSEADSVDILIKNTNSPPVSDAGNNASVKAGFSYQLDGTNSFDPENDTIDYSWQQVGGPSVILDDATAVQPSFPAPVSPGTTLIFKLIVSDGFETSTPSSGTDSTFDDTVVIEVVDNSPPIAYAGLDQSKSEGALVQLDGSLSFDPDGDGIIYQWTQISGPPVVLDDAFISSPSFTAPIVSSMGDVIVFNLEVTDEDPFNALSANDNVQIELVNINDPPSCHLAVPSKASMWPPNHKLKDLTINGVEDPDSGIQGVTLIITSITQDEPVNGQGDGNTSPDAVIISDSFEFDRFSLRAERIGGGNGRVYEVNFTAADATESCSGSVQIGVPKSRKSTAIDDGQSFNSTQ